MTEIAFTAQQLPSTKWRLTKNTTDDRGEPKIIDYGVYDTPALAHQAIKIILDPPRHFWDPNGDEIRGHKQPD